MLLRSLLLCTILYCGSVLGGEFCQPMHTRRVVTVVTKTVVETPVPNGIRCRGCERVLVGVKRGYINPRACAKAPIYCHQCERVVVGVPRVVRRPHFNVGAVNSVIIPHASSFFFGFQL